MAPRAVIGADPGVNGGIILLGADGQPRDWFVATNATAETLGEALVRISRAAGPGTPFYLEKVGYIKGDGGKGSFTFGKSYGMLLMGAVVLGLKLKSPTPMLWQSALGCLSGGNKTLLKNKAIELFPAFHHLLPRKGITLALADALLIAEYGRRVENRSPLEM